MLGTIVNVNYFLGFVIVILGFVSAFLFLRPAIPRKVSGKSDDKPQITLITANGPLNMSSADLDHYLTKLSNNLDYIIKTKSDENGAEKIFVANKQFAEYVAGLAEIRNLTPAQLKEIKDARDQLKPHFDSTTHAKFDNDQNDTPQSAELLYEIRQDLETLIYLSKNNAHTVDVSAVDKLVRDLEANSGYSGQLDISSKSSDSIDFGVLEPVPVRPCEDSSHCTIVDLYEHQDVTAETDVFNANRWTSPKSAIKTRKQDLRTAKEQSLDTYTQKKVSSHGPSQQRRVTFNIPEVTAARSAQDIFASDRKKQRKPAAPRKDSLNSAYSDDQLAG